jgi:hypothetical protein
VHGSAVRGSVDVGSDSLRDHFLLAMPGLDAGLFSGSITYICEHGEAGAMGLVINQPLDLSLEEIFEHLDIADGAEFRGPHGSRRRPGTGRSRLRAASGRRAQLGLHAAGNGSACA